MNKFAWTVLLDGNKKIDLKYDYIETLSKTGDKIIFIFWETKYWSSKELLEKLEEKLGKLKWSDISISTEDKIDILDITFDEWIYEVASFEWEEVSFDEIKERFDGFEEIISIREAEISNKFWNRVIKVDFVY